MKMKEHFKISGFNNDKEASLDSNVVSHFKNNFVGVVSAQAVLPKFIIIAPDNDILKYFWYKELADVQGSYVRILKWLMSQYDRMVASHKEYLPAKAKRANEPIFIWIEPHIHESIRTKENELRVRFGHALNSVASLHQNIHSVKLKMWDPSEKSLYNKECRFTAAGMSLYWQAVDKSVRYVNTLLLKKKANMAQNKEKTPQGADTSNYKARRSNDFDRFHWNKSSHGHHR